MDERSFLLRLLEQVREYGAHRAKAVARGLETPRLAALLVQKYGQGVADAARLILGRRASREVMLAVDKAVERLDPDWRAHIRLRWESRPADLSFRPAGRARPPLLPGRRGSVLDGASREH